MKLNGLEITAEQYEQLQEEREEIMHQWWHEKISGRQTVRCLDCNCDFTVRKIIRFKVINEHNLNV